MTPEKKAAIVRNSFILLLAIAIPAFVFTPSKEKPKEKADKRETKVIKTTTEATDGAANITHFNALSQLKDRPITDIIAEAAKKRGGIIVSIIHCHVPGNPASEQMADILNRVARRYDKQVIITRVDIIACPQVAKSENVTSPPKIVMLAGEKRACAFQGLWTQAQIEQKVEELLRGLERMSKDWRPEVKGMQPMSKPPPLTPVKPRQP